METTRATVGTPLEEAAKHFLLNLENRRDRSPHTVSTYRGALRMFGRLLAESGMPTEVEHITREHVETALHLLKANGAAPAIRQNRLAEARKAAEAEPAQDDEQRRIDELVEALPDERQRYLADVVNHEMLRRAIAPTQPAELSEAGAAVEYLERLAALTEAEFATERAALDASIAELAAQEPQPSIPPSEPPPSAKPPPEPSDRARLDERRPLAEPPVAILPVGQHLEDHPSRQPIYRERL